MLYRIHKGAKVDCCGVDYWFCGTKAAVLKAILGHIYEYVCDVWCKHFARTLDDECPCYDHPVMYLEFLATQ